MQCKVHPVLNCRCIYNPKLETIISCAKFTSAVTRAAERGTTLELQMNLCEVVNQEEGPY